MKNIQEFWEEIKTTHDGKVESSAVYAKARELGLDQSLVKDSRPRFGIKSELIDKTWFCTWTKEQASPSTTSVLDTLKEDFHSTKLVDIPVSEDPFEFVNDAPSDSKSPVLLPDFDTVEEDFIAKTPELELPPIIPVLEVNNSDHEADFLATANSASGAKTKTQTSKQFVSKFSVNKAMYVLIILLGIALFFGVKTYFESKKSKKASTVALAPVLAPKTTSNVLNTTSLPPGTVYSSYSTFPDIRAVLQKYTEALKTDSKLAQLRKIRINDGEIELELVGKNTKALKGTDWTLRKLKDTTTIAKATGIQSKGVQIQLQQTYTTNQILEILRTSLQKSKLQASVRQLESTYIIESTADSAATFLKAYQDILAFADETQTWKLPVEYETMCLGIECINEKGFQLVLKIQESEQGLTTTPSSMKPVSSVRLPTQPGTITPSLGVVLK